MPYHILTDTENNVFGNAGKLAALGVDGITTNRPLWLRECLRSDWNTA